MSRRGKPITRARLVDGKVMIEQADGTFCEAKSRTDWARLRSLTDQDIERMAEEDGTADDMPKQVRVTAPFESAK